MGGSTAPDQTGDYHAASAAYKTVLTQGERTIVLRFASSRPELVGAKRPSFASQLKMQLAPPAMGYEFTENGQSLCAVQYFSEGMGGSNTFFVWMRRDVDPRSKLMLAAAMTAVLEMKCSESGPALPDDE
jgi:hypothetical protein